jgi:transcriptional regulator with XRE-family HTH domain
MVSGREAMEGATMSEFYKRRTPVDCFVASRLCAARKARGLTQKAVAHMLGVTPVHYCHYEIARTRITMGLLMRMADALKVPITHFFPTP